MRKVVGLDISLKKIAVCVLDRDGQLVWQGKGDAGPGPLAARLPPRGGGIELVWQGKVDAEPGPLAERLRPWRDDIDLVGLEACPLSEWLHRHLVADGYN